MSEAIRKRLLAMRRIEANGCWTADRVPDSDGYLKFWWAGVTTKAHRAAYILFKGHIESTVQVHHTCENRACFNPDHLKALFPKAHKALHRRAYCKYGHEFTPENTYVYPNGGRSCRSCSRRTSLAHMRKQRAEHPERQKEASRRYYERHRDEVKAKAAEYRRKNPEKVKQWNLESRARQRQK